MVNESHIKGIDDTDLFIHRYSPVCIWCRNLTDGQGKTCRAFPDGIPEEIWSGRNPHTDPVEGDQGIRFGPNDGYKPE